VIARIVRCPSPPQQRESAHAPYCQRRNLAVARPRRPLLTPCWLWASRPLRRLRSSSLAPRWAEDRRARAPRLTIRRRGVRLQHRPAAIRIPLQRRAGPQDRVDLDLCLARPERPPDSQVTGSWRDVRHHEASRSNLRHRSGSKIDSIRVIPRRLRPRPGRPHHRASATARRTRAKDLLYDAPRGPVSRAGQQQPPSECEPCHVHV